MVIYEFDDFWNDDEDWNDDEFEDDEWDYDWDD